MTFKSRVKSWFAQPRQAINSLLLLVFCAAWVRDFFYWFPKDAFGSSLNYWAYTDWLIDYSQGFIRRGLSGEITWRLVPAGTPPLPTVAAFSWILILLAAFGYARLLARSLKDFHPMTLFGLLFLPSLFFFYLHDHNAIARKEILGYLSLLLHLLVIEKSFPLKKNAGLPADNELRRYLRGLAPIAVLLLPAIILIHEGNFLLFVPLHAMLTLSVMQLKSPRGWQKDLLRAGLPYLPAALVFLGVYLSGTPGYLTLLNICKRWLAAGALREGTCMLPPDKLSGSTLPASLIPMQWPLARAVQITLMVIATNWAAWLAVLPLLGVSLWYLARQAVYALLRARSVETSVEAFDASTAQAYTKLFFRRYFLIPLLAALPIFLSAYDYGRWFSVLCVNYALVAASLNLPCREYALFRKEHAHETAGAESLRHLDSRAVFYALSIVICILALTLWLPHYCIFVCEIVRSPLVFFSHYYFVN
ncbi:MAG: hypothetical protein HPY72_12910 [Anaerolineae bacterium]|nr:hypothetical protein [Anaerolineae bacterium]